MRIISSRERTTSVGNAFKPFLLSVLFLLLASISISAQSSAQDAILESDFDIVLNEKESVAALYAADINTLLNTMPDETTNASFIALIDKSLVELEVDFAARRLLITPVINSQTEAWGIDEWNAYLSN